MSIDTTGMPPIPMPDQTGDTKTTGGKCRRRKLAITAAVCAVALTATGAGFGYRAWAENTRQSQLAQAQAACSAIDGKLYTAREAYKAKLQSKTIKDALAVTAKQVPAKDATRGQLAKLANLTATGDDKVADGCKAGDKGTVDATTARLRRTLGKTADATAWLDETAAKVLAARDGKTLADTKTMLEAKAKQARALLDSSDGKVADNATRVRLTQAIQQADRVKAGKDAAAMGDAVKGLDAAMRLVNESITAKREADKAAQQQAQARRSAGSGYSGSGYSGYGYSWSGGNGSYTGGGYGNGNSGNGASTSQPKKKSPGLDYTDSKGNKATPCDGDNCDWSIEVDM